MPSAEPAFRVERDIEYGRGAVGVGTESPRTRALVLDAFIPASPAPPGGRRAFVLAHGGAMHRGAKDKDEFEADGVRNTPVHEYAERFAARGYACFSIGYRLTQELPGPQPEPIKRSREAVTRGRIDFVRGLLGLPPATDTELIEGVEACYADVAAAFQFIHKNADKWGIDPKKMAIGGFSAGGYASAYSTYALGVPSAAVVCISAGMEPEDAEYYVNGLKKTPVLLFHGDNDLPQIQPHATAVSSAAEKTGVPVRHYSVTDGGHFYPAESPIVLRTATFPGGEGAATVEAAIVKFLDDALGKAQ
ncbi:Alpha/Beta hydrolase protein [Hyaloraphidium curvatum]|nr:Alpha/Beta hydrolase protein [Hyaloraphidium curvatum]